LSVIINVCDGNNFDILVYECGNIFVILVKFYA